jgi:excinuclease ABC subunit C
LEEALDTKVKIPVRGKKKALMDMVLKNAKEAHDQKFMLALRKDKEMEAANQKLSEVFGTDIHTIEMFDNSHIQGSFNVSAMVVYEDGVPNKNKYRHYKLDGYRSDADSMKEVLYRRYYRLLMEDKPLPDLLMVDGGVQQIKAASEIKEELGLDIPIAGLVKDEHHSTRMLMNENLENIELDRQDPLFFLLTRMQDEVDRFAKEYHKKLRSKSMTKSILDTVEGIGEKRKKALLKHFKSMKNMREASVEELREVLPEKQAELLWTRLHEKEEA